MFALNMGNIRRKPCLSMRQSLKNKKSYCSDNNISIDTAVTKKKGAISKVKYLKEEDIAKLNLYIKSLLDISYLNLEAFDKISIYFACDTSPLFTFLTNKFVVIRGFTDEQKSHVKIIWEKVFDLLGKPVEIAESLKDADVIIGNTPDYLEYYYTTTAPYDLDLFPTVLQGKQVVLYSGIDNDDNLQNGSYWNMIVMASAIKILGFKDCHEDGSISKAIPSVSTLDEYSNRGMYNMNNIWVTILSDQPQQLYIQKYPAVDWEANSYPFGPMSIDLLALQFLYDVKQVKNAYYAEWGLTETVWAPDGCDLDLTPNNDEDLTFNLNLDQFVANPASDGRTVFSCLSRSARSDLGGLVLERDSYYKQVLVDYPEINVFASTFRASTLIRATKNVNFINLYVSGNEADYKLEETEVVMLKNKRTGRAIGIESSEHTVINLSFCGRRYDFVIGGQSEQEIPSVQITNDEKEIPSIQVVNDENGEKEYIIDEKLLDSYKEKQVTFEEESEEVEEDEKSEELQLEEKPRNNSILANLKDEHYQEIVKAFKKEHAGYKRWDDAKLTKELNEFAVDFITRKFRGKIEHEDFKLRDRL